MTPCTQFIYVPSHANGDTNHPDCLRGFVAGPQMGHSIMVYFWKEVGVSLRTSYPQLTDIDRLIVMDSCQQDLVEKFIKPITPAQLMPTPPVPLDDDDREWGRETARKLGFVEKSK